MILRRVDVGVGKCRCRAGGIRFSDDNAIDDGHHYHNDDDHDDNDDGSIRVSRAGLGV